MTNRCAVLQIGVFANDVGKDGMTLGPGTMRRCDFAAQYIRTWQQGVRDSIRPFNVNIYLAAGRGGKWRGQTTFALAMRTYLQLKLGDVANRCRFVVNDADPRIWSSLAEVQWVLNQVGIEKAHGGVLFDYEAIRFVTNSTHARRVGWIYRLFGSDVPRGEFILSNEPPPPWWHEVCAYTKLGLHYLGLGVVFEPLRRRFYNG